MLCWDQLAETAQSILYLIVPPRSLSRFVTHFHILISVSSLDRRNIELSPARTSISHPFSSGARASLPFRARWTTGWLTTFSIVGRRAGSADMQEIMRSQRAGESGDRSTTEKSFSRRACQGAPPSGTQMFVAISRTTRPKLYCCQHLL